MNAREPTGARTLWAGGPTGLPLGVGTWAWGDRGYWGYGKDYTSADVAAAYTASREAGLTVFDTAEVYGRGTSERLLGGLIADAEDADAVAVATKFAALPWRVARSGSLLAALEASLARLGRPSVALYQIHWPLPVGTRAWLLGLAQAYAQGLVGAVGVSNYGPRRLRDAHRVLADRGVPLATNQVEYSLLHRRPERSGLVEVCRELGVTIIAYSPLAQGLLTGKYTAARPPSGVRALRYRGALRTIEPLVTRLTKIGADHDGRTPGQVALNWLVHRGAVPIPGAKTADQARHNAGGIGWSLREDEVAELSGMGAG